MTFPGPLGLPAGLGFDRQVGVGIAMMPAPHAVVAIGTLYLVRIEA